MQPQVAYLLLIVVTLVALGATTGYAWRHRRSPGGMRFMAFAVTAGAWVFMAGAMAIADPATARVLLSVKYLAIGAGSIASFLFIAQRTGHLTWLTPAHMAGLLVIPLVGSLASFTDGAGMINQVSFGRAYELTHVASISFGPIYWVFTLYLYTLILTSIAFLFLSRRDGGPLQRSQAVPMLLGVTAPLVSNVLLITGIAPRAFDPMPFGIAISAMGLWWGAFRGRILDLVPGARHVLIDSLPEGILIVDHEERILDMNTTFARLASVVPRDAVGLTVAEWNHLTPGMRDTIRSALAAPPQSHGLAATGATSMQLALPLGKKVFDVRVIAGDGRAESPRARIVVLQDVTERQQWEDEQARLIEQLRDALGQVRTLTGLLPICSDCKRIRDSAGEWQHLEIYIRDRTDAEFSHGMCPSCVDRWYPE